jgi:CotS family spore coat protein
MAIIKRCFNEIAAVLDTYHILPNYQAHRSVYFAPQQDPIYVLKPLRIGAIKAHLIGRLLVEEELSSIVPRLIKPESGSYYLWYSGNRYLATEKIPGRVADYYSVMDLKAAVITMANFHRISRQLIQSNPARWSILQFNPQLQWRQYLREMEICREIAIRFQGDLFSRQYLQKWHLFYEMAFRVLQEFPPKVAPMQETLCYHDWAFHNVIIEQERAHLIDFDDMIVDHSIHDRVNLISRYLRLHHWSIPALLKTLWYFDHFYHWQKGDLKLLRLYLTFPYEYWILGRQYYIEKQPWSRRYYQDQWQRKISLLPERLKVLDLIDTME